METVFDALRAMGKASSQEVAARLGMTRDEAINELWKLKRRGWADNKGPMWWLTNEKSDDMSAQSTVLVQVVWTPTKTKNRAIAIVFRQQKNMSRAKKRWRTLRSRCHRLLKRERMTWFYHRCIWQTANCVGRKVMSRSGSESAPRCGS